MCFAKNISGFTRVKFQLASTVLVFLQLFVLVGLIQRIVWPNCVATWQCHGTQVCVPFKDASDTVAVSYGTPGECNQCGDVEARAKLKAYVPTPDFSCPAYDLLCRACYDSKTGAFHDETYLAMVEANIEAMTYKDWVTVVLTSGVIGLAVAMEIQEIILCELTRLQLSQEAQGGRGDPSSSMVWICLERLNAYVRSFVLLPLVLACAIQLVVFRGGDALNVCWNALAIVFLLDCDNLLYESILDDRTRALVHDEGWVEIDDTVAEFLAQTKFAHFLGVTIGIPACIAVTYSTHGLGEFVQTITNALCIYWLLPMIAILETQLKMRVKAEGRCHAILVVLGKAFFGKYSHELLLFLFPQITLRAQGQPLWRGRKNSALHQQTCLSKFV